MATHLGQGSSTGQPKFPQMLETSWTNQETDVQRETKRVYNGTAAAFLDGTTVVVDRTISTTIAPLGKAVKETTTDDDVEFAGITDSAIAVGDWGDVVTKGVKKAAIVSSAGTAAGDVLQVSNTTASLETAGATTELAVARALTAYAAGYCDVVVTPGVA